VARNTIGFTVLGGMIASTGISIFIVPLFFLLFTRISYGKRQLAYLQAHHEELMEKEKSRAPEYRSRTGIRNRAGQDERKSG
jgi:hypothetical protein